MGRRFDGVDDVVTITQHATLNDWNVLSLSAWIYPFDSGELASGRIFDKNGASTDGAYVFRLANTSGSEQLVFQALRWQTTNGSWTTPIASIDNLARNHIAVTYDYGADTNDPIIYINGVVQSFAAETNPVGTTTTETQNLCYGDRGTGDRVFSGDIGWCVAANEIWDAAAVNRARWWGRPHGGLAVYHPMLTDKLTNEGTATATGVNTGSAVFWTVGIPVVRPGFAMMGCGVGF